MTSTKLGFHVATGSRNGYGPAAAAGPALVVAVGTAGAFDELPPETRKVYRDISLWANVPHGYQTLTPEQIRGNVMAAWGPALELIYQPIRERYANVWFQPTNEMAGNTPHEHAANAALEQAFVDYFTPRGYKLCLFNFSGGDPSIEDWQDHYWPVLAYAADLDAGHAYGRHVYGGVPAGAHNMLTQGGQAHSDNTRRPFVEADALWAAGVRLPVFLTEAGQFGGYKFPGVPAFMEDARAFDILCSQHPNLAGFALWTYGDYQGRPANIEPASAALASYLGERSIAPIELPQEPAPPPVKHKAIVVKAPQEVSAEEWLQIADYAYDFRHTFTASHDDTLTILQGGRDDSYAKIVYPSLPSQQQTIDAIDAAGYSWVDVTGDVFPEAQPFDVRFWPCEKQYPVTQAWAARPEYYVQFGWTGGHEGIDFGVPLGRPFFAVDDGAVIWASDKRRSDPTRPSAYGWHVVIGHEGGYKTLYAHCAANPPVEMGQTVQGGDVIAYSGNTGNSTGPHLHFSILQDGARTPGFPAEYIDPTPWLFGDPPEPPPPAGQLVDVAAYMFPAAPVQYMVRNANGNQERYITRPHAAGYVIQKNSQGEYYEVDSEYVYLVWDTSPDNDRYYRRGISKTLLSWAAAYCPRYMRVGQSWQDGGHYVQFFNKSDCTPSELYSGNATQTAQLLALYDTFTTPAGRICGPTIKLSTGAETHYFAKGLGGEGLGRVGWESAWGSAWATAEDVSGQAAYPLQIPSCM